MTRSPHWQHDNVRIRVGEHSRQREQLLKRLYDCRSGFPRGSLSRDLLSAGVWVFYSGVPPVSTRGSVRDTRVGGAGGFQVNRRLWQSLQQSLRDFWGWAGPSERPESRQWIQVFTSSPPCPSLDVSGSLGGGWSFGQVSVLHILLRTTP